MKDLHAGFQILNLKNDSLRRRSDSIKYNVSTTFQLVALDLAHKNFIIDEKDRGCGLRSCLTGFSGFKVLKISKDLAYLITHEFMPSRMVFDS